MRRLAAKRQREAPPERSGKLLTNVGPAAGRGEGSAAAQHQTGPGPRSHPWHGLAAALGSAQPRTAHSLAARASVSPPFSAMLGMPGWAGLLVGCGGHPGSAQPGRAPQPAAWQPARHEAVLTPPRHSPGAGCAGCVEPGVPSPGPAPLCQHSGHPESPPALTRRAPCCRDTLGFSACSCTHKTPPERSSGSSDTRSPGFGCGRKCPNIPWSPGLRRVLPWLSHGSQAPESFFLL